MINDESGENAAKGFLSASTSTASSLGSTTLPISLNDIVAAALAAGGLNQHLNNSNLTQTAAADALNSPGALAAAAMFGSAAAAAANLSGGGTAANGSAEYLSQLLRDKKSLSSLPNVFMHAERLVDDEIAKVRTTLFHADACSKDTLVLPEPQGDIVTVQEKVYVPVKEHPEYNFVGRILGPRGMTAKQLEQDCGCKIMVRGKGSMRDKAKEDANRGKPNWEHLNDDLHVLIQCEDTENRSAIKIKRAMEEVKKLLMPSPEGEDELKRKQLLELAIINGTYRPASQTNNKISIPALPRLLTPLAPQLRSPSLGAPIYLPPASGRGPVAASATPSFSLPTSGFSLQSLMPSTATAGAYDFTAAATGGFLVPIEQLLSLQAAAATFPYAAPGATFNPNIFGTEYATADSQTGALQRRILAQSREHPYKRHGASPAM